MYDNEENKDLETNEKNNNNSFIVFALIITVGVLVILFLFFGVKNSTNDKSNFPNSTTRSATVNDMTINSRLNISSLGEDITIVPKYDIDNLTLKLSFLDSKNNVLSTKTHTVGNVKRGNTYNITVSITEFSFTTIFKIDSVSIMVKSGTVHLT